VPLNRTSFLIFFYLALVLTIQPNVVAQMSCGVVNLRVQRPETALAGGMIQISSIVTVGCIYSTILRVDLVDSGTNTILSSVYWSYNPEMGNVSPPLVNNATAPNELGYWALSIRANLGGTTSGLQFTILIKPNT
jgi:hypothetical protein